MSLHWLRPLALAVSSTWAIWVVVFAVGEAALDRNWFAPVVVVVLMVVSIVVGWRYEPVGGILLLLEGLLVCLAYPIGFLHAAKTGAMLFVIVTLGLPPILSGLLYLSAWNRTRSHPAT